MKMNSTANSIDANTTSLWFRDSGRSMFGGDFNTSDIFDDGELV
jgi:hypothetical protein